VRSRWLLPIAVALLPLFASCGGDHEAQPTIESVDFSPRLLVSVGDAGFVVTTGDTDNASITADPPSAPEGTVIEIRNTGATDRRVTDDSTIDTGVMQPGDSTTVVLTTEGDLELRDAADGATVKITVTPRATTN
jgi:hypothetical protein